MIAFFLSLLHAPDPHNRYWRPKIMTVCQSFGHPVKMVFSTTSANTTIVAKPVCLGIVEVTEAELQTIDGDNQIWAFDMAGWKTKLVSEVSVQGRGRLQSLLTDRELSPDIQLTDTLETAFVKLFASMPDNTYPSMYAMIAKYESRYGATGLV